MAENTKYMARVPIVPDDFENKEQHKNHEMVMDFVKNDIYVKNGEGYVNITGQIEEKIKEIQDGSYVVHIVTNETLPPIKDRKENHWYFVIEKSEDAGKGSSIATSSYIYYGLINQYDRDKNYILISQNMITESTTVLFNIQKDYHACFYVPISYDASFKYNDTKQPIDYEIEDRIYALNNSVGSFVAYDVYVLDIDRTGEVKVDVDLSGTEDFVITFDANVSPAGLKLPDPILVHDGSAIGEIPNPTWTDPRYIFNGWSTSRIAKVIIDPKVYKPEESMTLFAWFTYNSDPSYLEYYANYES